MNWIKTKLGEIAYAEKVDGKIPETPKGARIGMPWELLQIRIEEPDALKDFPRYEYIWCGIRACGLNFFGVSDFVAVGGGVDSQYVHVRGVFFIKHRKVKQ